MGANVLPYAVFTEVDNQMRQLGEFRSLTAACSAARLSVRGPVRLATVTSAEKGLLFSVTPDMEWPSRVDTDSVPVDPHNHEEDRNTVRAEEEKMSDQHNDRVFPAGSKFIFLWDTQRLDKASQEKVEELLDLVLPDETDQWVWPNHVVIEPFHPFSLSDLKRAVKSISQVTAGRVIAQQLVDDSDVFKGLLVDEQIGAGL